MIGIIILIQLIGADINLRYSYEGVRHGEYWRLLTAHFVHLGWTHLALNVFSLLLIWGLATSALTALYRLVLILVCGLGITLGLFAFSLEVTWYVGLSGILHGLFAAIVWQQIRTLQGAVLFVLLIVKLAWEQYWGALPATASITGGAVIVDAHLYGAITGLLMAVFRQCYQRK